MKRPSFQFYPADWRSNPKLRRCSEAARGAFMDVMCVLHDSEEYGVVRWPLSELARAAGVSVKLAKELAAKEVLKGADSGAKPYVHIPRHAGRDGEPVVLVQIDEGPVWYCSRMVRDEWIRERRGAGTRFDSENQPSRLPTGSPTRRVGERQGDGPSSSSSSSSSLLSVGKGEPIDSRAPDQPPSSRTENGTANGRVGIVFKTAGIFPINTHDPRLQRLIDAGVTDAEFLGAAVEAKAKGKGNLAYVCAAIEGKRTEAAAAGKVAPGARPVAGSGAHRPYVPEQRRERTRETGSAEAQAMADIVAKLAIKPSSGSVLRSNSTPAEVEAKNRIEWDKGSALLDARGGS